MHPVAHWEPLVQLPRQAAKPLLFALSWTAETVPAPSTAVTSNANKPFLMSLDIVVLPSRHNPEWVAAVEADLLPDSRCFSSETSVSFSTPVHTFSTLPEASTRIVCGVSCKR
jgi:hypothetical protein